MKHVGNKIQAYVADELTAIDRQGVEEHLASCQSCKQALAETRSLWDVLALAAEPEVVPTASAWAGIQAQTFGLERAPIFYGGGLWSKTGIAAVAMAAGLALAIFLPAGGAIESVYVAENEALGSSFWLEDQGDSGVSEWWLTMADDGSQS